MLEKSLAVVLHVLKYNDEQLVAHFYTERRGTLCFMIRMPRSRKNAMRTTLLSPLAILELVYDYRPQSAFQKLREMRVAVPYKSVPYEPMKAMVALFLGEFAYHALKHEVQNDMLFRYVVSALQWFDAAQRGVANFHLVFLLRMVRFLGFMPNVPPERNARERQWRIQCGGARFFDLREGVLLDVVPVHRDCLLPEDTCMLPFLLRMDFVTMHLYKFSRMQRMCILEKLILYYRLHVPEFPELKSLEVLNGML